MIWKIIIVIVCAILGWLGGRDWGHKMFRRAGVPFLLSLSLALYTKWWFFFPIGIWLGFTIPIGYGAYDPENDDKPSFLASITHDRQGWVVRGLYGLIVALGTSVWLFCFGFVNLWALLGYLALNFGVGAILCALRSPAIVIEPLVYAGIANLVFFVK